MDRFVSVVIPTLNSEGTIEECLKSVFSNENPPKFEVILVDGGSRDRTIEIAEQFTVKIDKPQAGQKSSYAESRNTCISKANGDIIAFTDSDARVTKNWLLVLSKHFDDPTIAGVGGPSITPDEDPFWAKCFGVLMESFLGSAGTRNTKVYNRVCEVKHNPPVNSALRKTIFLKAGGFPEGFNAADDVVLDAKIQRNGGKLIYDPKMVVWHHRRKTLGGFVKQLFKFGRGRASAFLMYPESLPVTYFCVAAFTIGTALSIPLYIFVDFLKPVIIIGWVIYLLFILFSSIYIAIRRREYILVAVLPFLAILEHFILGLGLITGWIKPYKESL
jgi:glycosyltransferase involved in cell wall biosynthesis